MVRPATAGGYAAGIHGFPAHRPIVLHAPPMMFCHTRDNWSGHPSAPSTRPTTCHPSAPIRRSHGDRARVWGQQRLGGGGGRFPATKSVEVWAQPTFAAKSGPSRFQRGRKRQRNSFVEKKSQGGGGKKAPICHPGNLNHRLIVRSLRRLQLGGRLSINDRIVSPCGRFFLCGHRNGVVFRPPYRSRLPEIYQARCRPDSCLGPAQSIRLAPGGRLNALVGEFVRPTGTSFEVRITHKKRAIHEARR